MILDYNIQKGVGGVFVGWPVIHEVVGPLTDGVEEHLITRQIEHLREVPWQAICMTQG
jgi:hypothetical protein